MCGRSLWHDVGHQALAAAGVLVGLDNRLAHPRMATERRLDLARFDTEPPYLHLAVPPAQQLQYTSLTPARRSPVAYIRDPGAPSESGTNRSAV